jgi:hypothetical protein
MKYLQGLLVHGFICISQYVPVNPVVQIQIYPVLNERHCPLFLHGNDTHGFDIVPQLRPVHPVGHKH